MTSKWITDLVLAIFNGKNKNGESPNEIVERIDDLLKESMNETDSEELHDKIEREIHGTD